MKDLGRILASIVISSVVGSALIFAYFAYIDLETYYANKAFWRGTDADWTVFAVVMAVLAISELGVGQHLARPIARWEQAIFKGEPADKVPLKIRQRAASYPLILAIMSLLGWLVAGLFFAQGGTQFLTTDPGTFGRTFLGIGIVGGITVSALTFMTADALWRQHLPVFFPEGAFQGLGVVRVTVGQRLITTFLLTGLMPFIILAVTTRNSLLAVMGAGVSPDEILARVSATVLFIVTLSIVSNLLLISLTSRSVLRPLRMLINSIDRVRTGDLSSRVTVTSHDELGDVGFQFNTMLTELERGQRMRDLFGRYVSKEVAEQALKDGAELGGANVPATVLFADIRDFTTLTESLPPQQVVDLLNRYYTRMVDAIIEHQGWVNKFGGDSLLAVFGAPIQQQDHALRAVQAAWAMNRAMAEFNEEQAALRLPPITIGIGISSGEMVAGNVGGKSRLEYTVIGDPVNLAARLESLTKSWKAPVLLSEHTQALLDQSPVVTRAREQVIVKGKTEPVMVYELQGIS